MHALQENELFGRCLMKKLRAYSSRVLFSLCMVGNETNAFDGPVQFWAVMPMMKRVTESVHALLGRELRWRCGRGCWRPVNAARASQIHRFQFPEHSNIPSHYHRIKLGSCLFSSITVCYLYSRYFNATSLTRDTDRHLFFHRD